ncbi:GHKL domain-containing protein [bacterium]|nr:GHKL domain-containing protein [bacterium]
MIQFLTRILPLKPILLKLQVVILTANTILLFLLGYFFLTQEYQTFGKFTRSDLLTMSKAIAPSLIPTLAFKDPVEAGLILDSLRDKKSLQIAAVYDSTGSLFAGFHRADMNPPPGREDLQWFLDNGLPYISRPLFLKNVFQGTLYVVHDLKDVELLLLKNTGFFLLALIISIGLVSFLSLKAQEYFSRPIISLAETAELVHRDQNYSIRSIKYGEDDLGILVDQFNGMLDGIQKREEQLKNAQSELQGLYSNLEEEVQERTSSLQEHVRLETSMSSFRQQLMNRESAVKKIRKTIDLYLGEITDGDIHFWFFEHPDRLIPLKVEPDAARTKTPELSWKFPCDHRLGETQGPALQLLASEEPLNQRIIGLLDKRLKTGDSRSFLIYGEESFPLALLNISTNKDLAQYEQLFVENIIQTLTQLMSLKNLEDEFQRVQSKLLESAHLAGMSEIASGALHNVGNILNGVKLKIESLKNTLKTTHFQTLRETSKLLHQEKERLGPFFREKRGQDLLELIEVISQHHEEQSKSLYADAADLESRIQTMANEINSQQKYARLSLFEEEIDPQGLIDQTLEVLEGLLRVKKVKVICQKDSDSVLFLSHSRILGVLVNLVKNAIEAMEVTRPSHRVINITVCDSTQGMVLFRIQDRGPGIKPEDRERLFSYGYSTKKDGFGVGLHDCALACRQLRASIRVVDCLDGACFEVEVPTQTVSEGTPGSEGDKQHLLVEG